MMLEAALQSTTNKNNELLFNYNDCKYELDIYEKRTRRLQAELNILDKEYNKLKSAAGSKGILITKEIATLDTATVAQNYHIIETKNTQNVSNILSISDAYSSCE